MKSIGNILKAARQKRNLTIDAVSKQVKIHYDYIRAMEMDDFSLFQGKVHSKGFLKIYANFLELDENEILALWRREYEPGFKDNTIGKFDHKLKGLEAAKFIVTPGLLISAFIGILLVGFFIFLYFQYRQYTDDPSIDIYYPQDNQVVVDDVIDITGKVDLDSEVFINTQNIIANPDGTFLTSVKLREGINTFSIRAVNRLEKETEIILNIIYRPEVEAPVIDTEEVPETTPAEDIAPEP